MPVPTETETLQAFLENPAYTIVAHLAKNPIAFDAETLDLADFTECDFVGYEPIDDFEWEFEASADDNYGVAVSKVLEWTAGEGIVGQTITAVYLTIDDGVNPVKLLWPFPFETPLVISIEGQTLQKVVRVPSYNVPD